MSTRPASPPPVARWPFVLGYVLCFAVAATALFIDSSPPGLGRLAVFLVAILSGIGLIIAPFIKEHEARTRIAEAQAKESIESQVRRLTQASEQLGNTISRSQSTEEQAGQALGTLEELTEKLNAQTDELAQNLARSHEREIANLKAEVDRHWRERDERLAALDQRLDTAVEHFSQQQLAARQEIAATGKTLEEVRERMIALAARFEEGSRGARTASSTRAIESASPPAKTERPVPVDTAPAVSASAPPSPPSTSPAADRDATPSMDAPPPRDAAPKETRPSATSTVVTATALATAEVDGPTVTPHPPTTPRPRVRRAPEAPAPTTNRIPARPQPMELPLLDLTEARPIPHREGSGATSTLVATAYIGIGNKLYVRGAGPGLSWEHGVPMQFLAIGKWGWTSPEAGEPITCRIYRNDETPMLDENIIIAPGAKAEIAPRF